MSKDEEILRDILEEEFDKLFADLSDDVEDDDSGVVTLFDENGNEMNFEFLDLIPYDGREFVVLLPIEDEDDASEVVILEVIENEDSGEDSYASTDEDDLAAVFEIFKERMKDTFDFV